LIRHPRVVFRSFRWERLRRAVWRRRGVKEGEERRASRWSGTVAKRPRRAMHSFKR